MLRALVRLLVVVAAVVASPAHAQLCAPAADPCVVSVSVSVPGDTVIDLGTRDLVIAAGRDITVQGTGTGALTITANDITFQDGARIVAPGVDGNGGSVSLDAAGAIDMQVNSRIDVTAGSGGTIIMKSTSAALNGQLRGGASLRESDGGFIDLTTTGTLLIGGGGISIPGGNGCGFGGFVFAYAGGDFEVSAPLETKGGCDGGYVDIGATGDLRLTPTASIVSNATLEGNDGGDVSLAAGGLVSVEGAISTNGQGSLLEGGGYGGDVDVLGRRVVLGGLVEFTGAGPDGDGGFLDVTAEEDILVTGALVASGAAEGGGGEVDLYASGRVEVRSAIDVRGGFVGGTFSILTAGPVVFGPLASVAADYIPGSIFGGYGGIIDVNGCDVTTAAGSILSCLGSGPTPRAAIEIDAGGTMTLGGSAIAGTQIALSYRGQPPVILPSATLQPAPIVQQDPTLPCCSMCTTTTSTSSTTSTSESSPTTTSTTATTVSTVPLTTTSTTSPSTSSSSSSTVTTVISSTTSTSLPLSCLDEPLEGYAAVECAVTHLQEMLTAQSEDALGGRKSAKRLAGKVGKTWDLVEKARTSPKAPKLLVKAAKKVVSFETQIARLLAKTKIEDGLATELLDLSGEISVRISGVLTLLTN